jgi:hypothetical protein
MVGATEALDGLVEQAGRKLKDLTGEPVEIRFNADRMSGGAFTKDDTMNELGISAGLHKGKMYVHVLAGINRLRDPSLATQGNIGHKYAHPSVRSIDEAVRWIRKNAPTTAEVQRRMRASKRELGRWQRQMVKFQGENGPSSMSLTDAVRSTLGHMPNMKDATEAGIARLLQEEKAMSRSDAAAVARGVYKLIDNAW